MTGNNITRRPQHVALKPAWLARWERQQAEQQRTDHEAAAASIKRLIALLAAEKATRRR